MLSTVGERERTDLNSTDVLRQTIEKLAYKKNSFIYSIIMMTAIYIAIAVKEEMSA